METPYLNPLTPQQIAALEAGDGMMVGEDPATHRVYMLIEQVEATVSDEYVRAKLDESQASIDRGEVFEWNVEEIKAEVRGRFSGQDRPS